MARSLLVASRVGLSAAALLVAAACADSPSSRIAGPSIEPRANPGTIDPYWIEVCKKGPAGTYNFTVAALGGYAWTYPNGEQFSITITEPGVVACKFAWRAGDPASPSSAVTVTELPGATFKTDSILVFDPSTGSLQTTLRDVSEATVTVNWQTGRIIRFYNSPVEPPPPPPPTGGSQGCTPGYWKQTQHFGSWVGYTPDQTFNSVFGVKLFGDNVTLLDALKRGGGGAARLGRHATAALLNTANGNVDYGTTTAGVIAMVQAAVASGDLNGASDKFEMWNERGCPLARAE